MAEWIPLVVYAAGWLIACRVLARYFLDVEYLGLFIVGFWALFWPLLLAAGVVAAPFVGLVWVATRGVDR